MAEDDFDPKKFLGKPPDKPFDPQAFLGADAKTAPPKLPDTEQRSIWERISTGFMDPIYGMAQIGARMSDPGEEIMPMPRQQREDRIAAIDKQIREREEGIQKRKGAGIDWWRLVGEAGNPVQYLPALTGGLAGAALSGMMAGATQPVADTKDFYSQKAHDAAFGAAFGLGGGAVTNIAGRVVSPIIGKAAQELLNRGVELTPGRLAGQLMSRMEDAARSMPWLGWFVRNAADRSNRSFNVAAINTALDPIGVVMPPQIPAGRPAVEFAEQALSNAYDSLLTRPGVQLTPDPQFLNDMAAIRLKANALGKVLEKNYSGKVHQAVGMRFLGGQMTGPELKAAESELGALEKRYAQSAIASERELGDLFGDVKDAIRDSLQRQNPQVAAELREVNRGWAMFKRIQNASSRRAGSGKDEGVFTPMDLAAAAKTQDPTRNKAAFARGDAMMQDLAEWGLFVMPQRLPDSGTTERALWTMLGIGAGTMGLGPAAALAAKGSAVAIPYFPAIMRAANRLARPSATRQGIRAGAEAATPFVGGAAGTSLGQEAPTMMFDAAGNLIDAAGATEAK